MSISRLLTFTIICPRETQTSVLNPVRHRDGVDPDATISTVQHFHIGLRTESQCHLITDKFRGLRKEICQGVSLI